LFDEPTYTPGAKAEILRLMRDDEPSERRGTWMISRYEEILVKVTIACGGDTEGADHRHLNAARRAKQLITQLAGGRLSAGISGSVRA